MVQVLEYPWNAVALDGGLPNVSSPTSTSNPFYFLSQRNIQRARVYLNPRTVMPVGTSTIPAGVQTQLLAIANAASATVAGTPLSVKLEWALQGCTEPTSAVDSRRPRLGWLKTFWEKVDDLLGTNSSTWGYAILSQPRVEDLWEANGDPDGSMATWADVSWNPNEAPWFHTAGWLEAATRATVTHMRAQGATKIIVVPTCYYPVGANPVKDAHPSGPWINDTGVWYEATVTPMGLDGYSATKPYAGYEQDADTIDHTYRDVWHESAFFTQLAGSTSVLDPFDLNPPPPLALPPEVPVGAVSLPPVGVTAVALNGGAKVSWSPPTYMGDGEFLYYQVEVTPATGQSSEMEVFRTSVALTLNAGPFANGTPYTASVFVVTSEGISPAASAQFIPSATAGDPVGGWHINPGSEAPKPPQTAPEPMVNAFPAERNFRPANWGKTPDEVEEGF
jgi:hypothetical protein